MYKRLIWKKKKNPNKQGKIETWLILLPPPIKLRSILPQ